MSAVAKEFASETSAVVMLKPTAPVPKQEAPQTETAAAAPPAPAKKRPPIVKGIVLGAILLAVLAGAARYGHEWYTLGRFQVSTDDAYVKADMSQLGAKVSGTVTDIPVSENAHVKVGDVVLRLDDGDFRLAAEAASARIETQQASLAAIDQQIAAQAAQVTMGEARIASAEAAERNAYATQRRTQQLVQKAVASRQLEDNSRMSLDQAQAGVTEAQAGLAASKAQIDVLRANRVQGEKVLAELQTALAKAERDLSFTEVKAPFDGIVANRAVEVGQFVQGGQRLMALVPDNKSFVEANFKETQLGKLHVGQKATIEIDAVGDETYEGRIESVSPASGAEFSLLPPENATGNFTKITQRVPVKVSVPAELAAKLRLGLSATITIDSRDMGNE